MGFKVGDKVLMAHFEEPCEIDAVRKDGMIHLKGDPKFVWTQAECLKLVGCVQSHRGEDKKQ